MSKEISPSLLSREMVKSAASLQRDSGEKTQQKRTQLETQGSSARLFSHGWHSSPLPFFLHEVSHDPGWLQLPLEPLTVPPLPHQACTALTFNPWPHWLSTRSFCQLPGFQMIHFCCPIFQISIHTYNLYSTDWGHYGDTTESAFLLKDLSCYTLTPTLRNQRWSVLYL